MQSSKFYHNGATDNLVKLCRHWL